MIQDGLEQRWWPHPTVWKLDVLFTRGSGGIWGTQNMSRAGWTARAEESYPQAERRILFFTLLLFFRLAERQTDAQKAMEATFHRAGCSDKRLFPHQQHEYSCVLNVFLHSLHILKEVKHIAPRWFPGPLRSAKPSIFAPRYLVPISIFHLIPWSCYFSFPLILILS